jgi:hypothetical protein
MPFRLGDVEDWHPSVTCIPTALAAITGEMPKEIGRLIHSGLHGRKLPEQLRTEDDVRDWLDIISLLGGHGTPRKDFSRTPFSERPTIEEWMARTDAGELELVFCDDGGSLGHVFATADKDVVDSYTEGKRIKFEKVPKSYVALRVSRTLRVW